MEIKSDIVVCSEIGTSEAATSEATAARGNNQSLNTSDSIIDLDSTSSPSTNLDISLTPTPYNQTHKKPVNDVFVPMYPSILERIGNLSEMRIDACQNLSVNHPLQPPYIQSLQTIHVEKQFEELPAGPTFDNPETTSSQPQPSTHTCDSCVLDELSNHYKGELPGFKPNSEEAFEIAPDRVVSKSPQHQQPNSQIATNTCFELIIRLDYNPYHLSATHSNISFAIGIRNLANKLTLS